MSSEYLRADLRGNWTRDDLNGGFMRLDEVVGRTACQGKEIFIRKCEEYANE